MDEEKLKLRIGANIASFRKQSGLTQAGLAEKLNYSDKAVSKWERGESLPDMLTMIQLAEQFGITVNDLLLDPDQAAVAQPSCTVSEDDCPEKVKKKADRRIILMLSSLLVWFVALLVFVILSSAGVPNSWISFFYAIPINAIVLLSLRSAWHDFRQNMALISIIVWGCLLSIHGTLWVFTKVNVWKIYLLGIPGQLAIWLWFQMFRTVSGKGEDQGE